MVSGRFAVSTALHRMLGRAGNMVNWVGSSLGPQNIVQREMNKGVPEYPWHVYWSHPSQPHCCISLKSHWTSCTTFALKSTWPFASVDTFWVTNQLFSEPFPEVSWFMIFQTFFKLFVFFLKTALWQGIHLTTLRCSDRTELFQLCKVYKLWT